MNFETFDATVAVLLSVGNTIYFVLRAERKTHEMALRSVRSESAYAASERAGEFAEKQFKAERAMWLDRERMLVDRIESLIGLAVERPAPVAATRTPDTPDAEERVRLVIDSDVAAQNKAMMEERIGIGAEQIVREYAARGLIISNEEARLQAESMLAGRSPTEGIISL